MNKEQIEIRHKGKVVNIIHRVLEHQGQYFGPFFCRYNGKKVEVKFEPIDENEVRIKDVWYIEE